MLEFEYDPEGRGSLSVAHRGNFHIHSISDWMLFDLSRTIVRTNPVDWSRFPCSLIFDSSSDAPVVESVTGPTVEMK